ncbi:hypothetical protein Q7P35_003990 [Cladosporium inversicolor]
MGPSTSGTDFTVITLTAPATDTTATVDCCASAPNCALLLALLRVQFSRCFLKGIPNRMIKNPGMFVRDIKRSFTGASKVAQQAAIEDCYNFDQVRNAMVTTTSRST